jgi:hypothetical protein
MKKNYPRLALRAKPLSTVGACHKAIRRLKKELEYTKEMLANARDDAKYWQEENRRERVFGSSPYGH